MICKFIISIANRLKAREAGSQGQTLGTIGDIKKEKDRNFFFLHAVPKVTLSDSSGLIRFSALICAYLRPILIKDNQS